MKKLKVLTFSTLFPSSVRPNHGIFVETRLRELLKSGDVEARVVAPVPWFPSSHSRWGDYAKFATTPLREQRHGIDVLHPRYLLVPKVGMATAPLTLASGARSAVRQLLDEGFDFDVIDAHYFYPDGVAAARLAREFGKPLVISARGSDVNLIGQMAGPRRRMLAAADHARACIGVSDALVDAMRGWGVAEGKLHRVPNGVNLESFRPVPRAEARARLGLPTEGQLLIGVGNLVELKGHHILIETLSLLASELPDLSLVLIGDGPQRGALAAQAQALGLAGRVRLTGRVEQEVLATWYAAADCMGFMSSREGLPNAVLECLACGTPVIATRVGGLPELITQPAMGETLSERTAPALADALRRWMHREPEPASIRRLALAWDWGSIIPGLRQLLASVTDEEYTAYA